MVEYGLLLAHADNGVISLEGGAYMCALFFFGALVERFGQRATLAAGALLAGAALLALGLGQQPALLGLACVALGLALGSLQIVTLTRFALLGARLGRGKTRAGRSIWRASPSQRASVASAYPIV